MASMECGDGYSIAAECIGGDLMIHQHPDDTRDYSVSPPNVLWLRLSDLAAFQALLTVAARGEA